MQAKKTPSIEYLRNESKLLTLESEHNSLRVLLAQCQESLTDVGKDRLNARIDSVEAQIAGLMDRLERLERIRDSTPEIRAGMSDRITELRRSIRLHKALGECLKRGMSERQFWSLLELGAFRSTLDDTLDDTDEGKED